ncbi:MAG: DNA polymerase III subunit gamma/tau, partial [Pseudomonadota bacterium]
HVKFLFATTEVNKVPVTVLSRCQRFDLRRISGEQLAEHFAKVAEAEGVAAEPAALAMIARAAEGSARDGLSILDQAIAHAGLEGGGVTAAAVREMLGLSDRSATRDLLALLLSGDAPGALAALRRQYGHGVDPLAVLRALLEAVHGTTLVKLGATIDAAQPSEEREAYGEWAGRLSFPALHRLWQLLLKGHDEVARAALPVEAAEMALLRVVHASSLPDPGELARRLGEGGAPAVAPRAPGTVGIAASATSALPADLPALVELLAANGRHQLAVQVETCVRAVSYAPPELIISTAKPVPADLPRTLAAELRAITGQMWQVTTHDTPGAPTIAEARATAEEAERQAALDTPVVQAALAAFPDAILESWPKRSAQ